MSNGELSKSRVFWVALSVALASSLLLSAGAFESLYTSLTVGEIESSSPQDTYGVSWIFLWVFCSPALITALGASIVVWRSTRSRSARLVSLICIVVAMGAYGVLSWAHYELKSIVFGWRAVGGAGSDLQIDYLVIL